MNSSRPHIVKDLIDWDTKSWKVDMISDLIYEDHQDIELLALGDQTVMDRIIWSKTVWPILNENWLSFHILPNIQA